MISLCEVAPKAAFGSYEQPLSRHIDIGSPRLISGSNLFYHSLGDIIDTNKLDVLPDNYFRQPVSISLINRIRKVQVVMPMHCK